MEFCSIRRRSSTVSPRVWKCKRGKERRSTRLVRAWKKASLPTLPGRPGLNWLKREISWLHVRWIFLFVEPSTNLPTKFRPENRGHQGARTMGMSWKQSDQSHTHERFRPSCDTGPGILGHRSSFVCSWSLAARFATCE